MNRSKTRRVRDWLNWYRSGAVKIDPTAGFTFAELESADVVSADSLIWTLFGYALPGWAISGRVVISILKRTVLTPAQKSDLMMLAEEGIRVHDKMLEPHESTQYRMVLGHLQFS